ncbi:DoxX family protein [Conexibacter woesei]|uniref:DoxX family protein n=1 Tax=Conexibacter woesei (strain DSM 14684 / CCUG 47730 / CIP 108061 / JCM 11494 / NBRC 100937 / ID131577) TaxID=469383 RepID=D3F3G3_CONWI|nr:DoxX family protein [Conexibacter woesei]ADB52328.1 DoxX family protein [Conexibacter woesei DSM 14684]
MKLGLLLVRTLLGGLMIGHGTQKLFGWFGGHGPDATGQYFEGLGLVPGRRNALAAGASEAGGGALLALGLCTPLAGAGLTGAMTTAIATVHAPRGPWASNGGWEYNAVVIATVFAVVDAGPGALSLDAVRGRERWGSGWALAQLGAGMAGSAVAIAQGRRNAAARQAAAEPAPPADAAASDAPDAPDAR